MVKSKNYAIKYFLISMYKSQHLNIIHTYTVEVPTFAENILL